MNPATTPDPAPAGGDADVIRVGLGSRSYDVVVGEGVLDELGPRLAELGGFRRAALVTAPAIGRRYGERVRASLETHVEVTEVVIHDGEEAKNLETLAEVFHGFAAAPLNRDDVVIALGGGVVGDLAGFAAASWNRGTALVQVPTTLLAQVDSSVGGKTGVNVPEGKNLVGAFHQPVLVLSDVGVLASLPPRELLAGLGEVVKYGFIRDPEVLRLAEDEPDRLTGGDPEVLAEIVRRGVTVKAEIVSGDEREAGDRMLLNYGHTVGHAIESLTGYGRYRHGEAVALGMVVAASAGELLGVSRPGLTQRTVALLGRLGLPTGGLTLDPDDVWARVALDKKTSRSGVRMVLCPEPGQAQVYDGLPREVLDGALGSVA